MYPWLELYAPYLAPLALLLALIAVAWELWHERQLRKLQARYTALTAGTSGGSFETVLQEHLDNVQQAAEKATEAWKTAALVERQARGHVQHVAVVRYNPFDHTGGDQSFVIVLADADGNGVVINSLHARNGTRIYAKPLAAWESSYTLTEEEQRAIASAQDKRV